MGEGEVPISGEWGDILNNGGSTVEDWRSNVNPMEVSPIELNHHFTTSVINLVSGSFVNSFGCLETTSRPTITELLFTASLKKLL